MKRILLLVISSLILLTVAFAQENQPKIQQTGTNLKMSDKMQGFKVHRGPKNNCLMCHQDGNQMLTENQKQAHRDFAESVHAKKGIELHCADCHGGNSETGSMSPADGWIGKPNRQDIPFICSRCHSSAEYMKKFNPSLPVDQFDKYQTSMHGKQLANGKTVVAVCSDCHTAHKILPGKEPTSSVYVENVPATCGRCHSNKELMQQYGTKPETKNASQYSEYVNSVHGKKLLQNHDTAAPACNSCHGSHGAEPPEVSSVAMSCQKCHPRDAELFLAGPHKKAFTDLNLPQCATCHTKHSIYRPVHAFINKGTDCFQCHNQVAEKDRASFLSAKDRIEKQNDLCFQCHDQKQNDKALTTIKQFKNILTTLGVDTTQLKEKLHQVETKGLDISKTLGQFSELKGIQTELRTLHHRADFETKIKSGDKDYSYHELSDKGNKILGQVKNEVSEAEAEFDYRRDWVVFASLILVFFAVMLGFKIKEIENRKRT